MEAVENHKPKDLVETFKLIIDRIFYNKKLVIFTERSILTDRHVFAEMLYDNKDINSELTFFAVKSVSVAAPSSKDNPRANEISKSLTSRDEVFCFF